VGAGVPLLIVLTGVLVSGMLNGAKFRIDEVVFGLARKQL
jgi:hypothetical protein